MPMTIYKKVSDMMIKYKTQGTCSREISIVLDGDVVKDVDFLYGCPGNLQGIKALVKDMKIDDVISKLEGIVCGQRGTSCPDQLATALKNL